MKCTVMGKVDHGRVTPALPAAHSLQFENGNVVNLEPLFRQGATIPDSSATQSKAARRSAHREPGRHLLGRQATILVHLHPNLPRTDRGTDRECMNAMMRDDHPWPGSGDNADESGIPPIETMIIRRWQEPDHPQGFRARITYGQTPGIARSTVSTADPNEVLRVVQQWLAGQPGIAGGK